MTELKHEILLAAASERACETLKGLINEDECSVTTATDGTTLRCIDIRKFDIIMISLPLSNEGGLELINYLRRNTDAPIVLLVKAEHSEYIYEKTLDARVYIIEKPLYKSTLMQAVRFLDTHARNEAVLTERLREAEKQNAELKAVFRAKLILMEADGMSEADAHRYLQQRAMNERKSLLSTAETVISEHSN